MPRGKYSYTLVLVLLMLSVLFPLSSIDLYETNRAYKFLDAALVIGVVLLSMPVQRFHKHQILIILTGLTLSILPVFTSNLTQDARMHAVPLLFLLLVWGFWSEIKRQWSIAISLRWSFISALVILTLWSFGELLPLLFDGSITHQETYAVSAGLGHRNLLVQILLIMLPLLLVFSSNERRVQYAQSLLGFIVIGLVLLLLNRTAWIGLLLMGGFGLFHWMCKLKRGISWKLILFFLLPVVCLLLLVDELYTIWHQLEMTFAMDEGTTRDRLLLLQRSVQMFFNQPLIGNGYGTWAVHALGFDQTGMLSSAARLFYLRPHNDYLRLFAEGGVLLGFAYVALHACALFRSWIIYRSEATNAALGMFLFWLMIILASSTNYPMEQPLFLLLQGYGLSVVFPLGHSTSQFSNHKLFLGIKRFALVALWAMIGLISYDYGGARVLFAKAAKFYNDQDTQPALNLLTEVREAADLDSELHPFEYWEVEWNGELDVHSKIALLQSGLSKVPYHPHLHESLGRVYLEQGDQAAALLSFIEALRFTPDYQDAWLGVAEIHHGAGGWREALRALLKADESAPTDRYRELGIELAQDSLTSLAAQCADRKMQLTLIAIRNTPDWSLDILQKTASNQVRFDHQAYVDACFYMLKHCEEYEDCDLAKAMINRYLPGGMNDLNLEEQ